MHSQSVRQERQKVLLIVGFIYILPVVLIFVGLIPFSWRFAVLIISAMVIVAIARLYRFSAVELGFTQKHLRNSLQAISLPTFGVTFLVLIHYITQGSRLDNSAYNWTFYLLFIGLSSPVQEFLYRGFLFSIFSRAKLEISLQIILSSFLYSFVHLIYRDLPTLVFTFIVGLLWGYYYAKFGNLYSIIVSHSLLGAIAIIVGLV